MTLAYWDESWRYSSRENLARSKSSVSREMVVSMFASWAGGRGKVSLCSAAGVFSPVERGTHSPGLQRRRLSALRCPVTVSLLDS